jgi:16S rRNA (uracil1498-N3)-methyltransferase
MAIPRIYADQSLRPGTVLEVSGQSALHITQVLRLRMGAALRLFDGNGHECEATLQSFGRGHVTLLAGAAVEGPAEPALDLYLAQGITRHDRMDLILQKAVELGVSTIQPLWMQRSQSHLKGERMEKRVQHWQGVIISACEQCGRNTLPALLPASGPAEWLQSGCDASLKLMLQPGSPHTLPALAPPDGRIVLLVGPEGGLNAEEQGDALAAGFTGLRLGQRLLRTETAALAALAGMQVLWGDYRQG